MGLKFFQRLHTGIFETQPNKLSFNSFNQPPQAALTKTNSSIIKEKGVEFGFVVLVEMIKAIQKKTRLYKPL